MPKLSLWYYIEGKRNVFKIRASPNDDIGDLKARIYDGNTHYFAQVQVDASSLTLTKVDRSLDVIKDQLSAGIFRYNSNEQPLDSWNPLSHVWPLPPPNGHLSIYVGLPDSVGIVASGSDRFLESALVKEYEDIFISVNRWGSFEESDIELNSIQLCDGTTQVPVYVKKLDEDLKQKPDLAPDAYDVFKVISDIQLLDAYFGHRKNGTIEDGSSEQITFERGTSHKLPRRNAKRDEVSHLFHIAACVWERTWDGSLGRSLKERQMCTIFFLDFICGAGSMITALTGQQPWPFKLILDNVNVPTMEQLRTFRPRSDFIILQSDLPRLIVEVQSKPGKEYPEDLVRMLVTGAGVVRFANKYLDKFAGRQFVLVAAYIWENGNGTIYSLFQELKDSNAVYYTKRPFRLNDSASRAEFALWLYNLRDLLENEGETDYKAFRQLTEKIKQHRKMYEMKDISTRDNNTRGSKRNHQGGDGGDPGAGGGAAGSPATDYAEFFGEYGYDVRPEPKPTSDESGETEPLSLPSMPPHILTVTDRSDPSRELIAKKVRKQSDELKILKLLNTFQPNSKHVISLQDWLQRESTSWVILPKMESLEDYLIVAPKRLYGKVAEVCWGLIKGVAFLHNLRIAHRDIKPANLVLDRRDFCLKIIDFDTAIQMEDEDEEISGQCGTIHWMAPEIVRKSMYSPVKADRWSCGRVILYLLAGMKKEDELLRSVARKLTAYSPNQRLSMPEAAQLVSDVASVASKRKVSRSLQVDGENVKPPNAKKPKLTMLDGDQTVVSTEREHRKLMVATLNVPVTPLSGVSPTGALGY